MIAQLTPRGAIVVPVPFAFLSVSGETRHPGGTPYSLMSMYPWPSIQVCSDLAISPFPASFACVTII